MIDPPTPPDYAGQCMRARIHGVKPDCSNCQRFDSNLNRWCIKHYAKPPGAITIPFTCSDYLWRGLDG